MDGLDILDHYYHESTCGAKNIVLQISMHKLLASKIGFIKKGSTRPFFLTELIEKCSFCPLQI